MTRLFPSLPLNPFLSHHCLVRVCASPLPPYARTTVKSPSLSSPKQGKRGKGDEGRVRRVGARGLKAVVGWMEGSEGSGREKGGLEPVGR